MLLYLIIKFTYPVTVELCNLFFIYSMGFLKMHLCLYTCKRYVVYLFIYLYFVIIISQTCHIHADIKLYTQNVFNINTMQDDYYTTTLLVCSEDEFFMVS